MNIFLEFTFGEFFSQTPGKKEDENDPQLKSTPCYLN